MARDHLLSRIIDQIGYLLNAVDPHAEVNKLISLELTLNPLAKNQSFEEIFGLVVNKLIDFYQDDELRSLWEQYILLDTSDILDDYSDYYDEDDEAA